MALILAAGNKRKPVTLSLTLQKVFQPGRTEALHAVNVVFKRERWNSFEMLG